MAGRPVADVAKLAGVVESNGVSLAQAGDHPGDLPCLHVHHLHLGAVGDIEALGRRIHRQIVPVAHATDDPCLLDEEGAAGQFGGRGRLLRRQSGATQQAKGKQSLHRRQLLMSRCGIGGKRSSFFQFMDVFGFSGGISSGNGGFDLVILR